MRVWHLFLVTLLSFGTDVASAQTIDVSDLHGGLVNAYQNQWATLAAQGVKVRIVGPCVSACTLFVGYVPRRNICVMPNAYLGFHWGHYPLPHARDVERLSVGYPPVDQSARRPDGSDDMAAGSDHLPLLS